MAIQEKPTGITHNNVCFISESYEALKIIAVFDYCRVFSAFVILRNQIITHSLNSPIDSLSSAVRFGENGVKFGREITKILACEIASDPASK